MSYRLWMRTINKYLALIWEKFFIHTVGEYAACANIGGQGSQVAECDVTASLPAQTERASAETTTFATAPDSGSSQRKMKENMKLNLAKVSRIHLSIYK